MNPKIENVITSVVFFSMVLVQPVLSATVFNEYAGSGQLSIASIIITPNPYTTLDDTITTDAEGYDGYQLMSSDYGLLWCEDVGNVENGEIILQQSVVDDYDGQTTYTTFETGVDGTGSVMSYVEVYPKEGVGLQQAVGDGDTHAYFSQSTNTNDEFDYEMSFGAGTDDCDDGIVFMENYYTMQHAPAYYSTPFFGVYCADGCSFVDLYGNATDMLNLVALFDGKSTSWFTSMNSTGDGLFNAYTITDETFAFDYDMMLG